MALGGERSIIAPTAVNQTLVDPGDAGTISNIVSGSLNMVSGGVETRTLAKPSHAGQTLDLFLGEDGGNVTVTLDSGGAAGEGALVYSNSGDLARLVGVYDGEISTSGLKWAIVIRVTGTSSGAPALTFP